MASGGGVVPRAVGGPVAVRRAVRRAVGRAVAVMRGVVVTVASVGGAAMAVSSVAAIQGVFCTAGPAVHLIRRAVAATVVPAGMVAVAVTSLVILLLEQLGQVLPCGLPPLVFSRAVFLVGGAVVGMVVLAGASGVAGRLLLAPGWLLGFWWVA